MKFTSAQAQGKRDYQEDSACCAPPFFAVADGMGGHSFGDVASQTLIAGMVDNPGHPIDMVNAGILAMRRTNEAYLNPRMGTTLTALWILSDLTTVCAMWMQAGDSRLYHLRGSALRQVTTDECLPYPQDNELLRCIRADEEPPLLWSDENMGRFIVEKGDLLILCSDGVSFYLDPAPERGGPNQIAAAARIGAEELVRRAIELGGHDNATAIVIEV